MPRGRGSRHQELPPRARRILVEQSWRDCCLGTTSACAENTPFSSAPPKPSGNYLRVRGEYHETLDSIKGRLELPPRARRIREVGLGIIGQPGTTSACAENTRANSKNEGGERNYLRVRGEYPRLIVWLARARGTTSACAENTGFHLPGPGG